MMEIKCDICGSSENLIYCGCEHGGYRDQESQYGCMPSHYVTVKNKVIFHNLIQALSMHFTVCCYDENGDIVTIESDQMLQKFTLRWFGGIYETDREGLEKYINKNLEF